jgi:hypothetical protein
MSTRDTSFIADGALSGLGSYPIGYYANSKSPRAQAGPVGKPFQVGTLAVGQEAGVYGATDDVVLPQALGSLPGLSDAGSAGVCGYSVNSAGVLGAADNNYGVFGYAPGNPLPGSGTMTGGVYGFSPIGFGVKGWSDHGYGVFGESGADAYGVFGTSWNNHGVAGSSTTGSGVVGMTGSQSRLPALSPNTAGVFGIAGDLGPAIPNPDLPGDAAVMGSSDTAPGVIGTSRAQAGVYGFSKEGDGVVGHSTNYAGFFIGNLLVVNGIKAAAVPFPDRTHRVLYCMESPELWFEDFGTAKLRRGRAVVKPDADFAKVIKRGDYRVFPAPEGDCHGLYVRRKSANSFEVRELRGGKSNVTFSYRIVGRRKDIKGQRRFAKVDALRRVPPRQRAVRSAPRAKIPQRLPGRLRALATRMEKQAEAQMSKRARKRKSSAR